MTRYIDYAIFTLVLLAAAGAECIPLLLILTAVILGLTVLKEIRDRPGRYQHPGRQGGERSARPLFRLQFNLKQGGFQDEKRA